jgi:adenine deaminase
VTDPHEIANVTGTTGIDYMLASTESLPLDVYVMLPSCVPATSMDESGAVLDAEALEKYLENDRVLGLAELMNSFGTVQGDEGIFRKLQLAKKYNKLVDGHAPGLQGKELDGYITAGVASDHECSTVSDAMEKLKRGQWIMIREGTAAKNMDALIPLFKEPFCNRCMFVTDDKHPSDLIKYGHMDYLIRKAVKNGADPIHAIKMVTKQPAEYFGLRNSGAIAPGYKADLVLLDNLQNAQVKAVYKDGLLVAKDNNYIFKGNTTQLQKTDNSNKTDSTLENADLDFIVHSFHMEELESEDFVIEEKGKFMRVIELTPGELLTKELKLPYTGPGVDITKDIIKLAVVERHHNTGHIGLGFLKGYGLKNGAVASSIAHDSHNLIIVGTNDTDMCLAANRVRKNQGGIAIASEGRIVNELALPIAGLMCDKNAEQVEKVMTAMKAEARDLGVSQEIDPFMTLAFISLPVIPEIRLTTLGLVDVENQKLVKTILTQES